MSATLSEPDELVEQWEAGRAGKPLDFPALVFGKLAIAVTARLGSRDRHRHLQDLTDLLAPYKDLDPEFAIDMETAAKFRDRIYKEGLSDGHLTLLEQKEAVDTHQRLWLAAIMRMLKRRGLLGETWIKG